MSNEMEQQATLANAGKNVAAFMEADFNKLKGRLEEKAARSHAAARWEGMIEDCQIILNHLESKSRNAGEKNGPLAGYANVSSHTAVRDRVSPASAA
jgi:hypothetical protein